MLQRVADLAEQASSTSPIPATSETVVRGPAPWLYRRALAVLTPKPPPTPPAAEQRA